MSDPARRLNVGCGTFPLLHWTNLDADPGAFADVYADVPPLPFGDGALDEIYAGHFFEHLPPARAGVFLDECARCLVPGGILAIVVPDTREVMRRYVAREFTEIEYPEGVWSEATDLDTICRVFLYSTEQQSPHVWSYDEETLGRVLTAHGFRLEHPIDRFRDHRLGTPRWYQCGWQARKA